MALPPSNEPEVWHLITQVITWLVVIGGWMIVNFQNNARERRKEIRQVIDKLCMKIEEIEHTALTFHKTEYNAESADKLRLTIDKVVRTINRLEILDTKNLNRYAINLRKSITLKNFDTTNHVPLSGTELQLAYISDAADELISAIEDAYSKRYLR